jgi:hypothetical protein
MEYSLKGREVIPVRDPVYTKELGTFAQFMNPK